jgi:Nif-specific regulatory protein
VFDCISDITTIGRSSENLLEIDDINSSRYHCEIIRTDKGFMLKDLDSRNGTLLNGKFVSRSMLNSGDRIEIGQTQIYFEEDRDSKSETVDISTKIKDDAMPAARPLVSPHTPVTPLPGIGIDRQEQLLKLLEINLVLSGELNLTRLLEFIMDTVVDVVGGERGFLILEEEGKLNVKVSRNIDRESIKKPDFKVSHSIAAEVFKAGSPLITSDASEDERFSGYVSVYGMKLRSVLGVPLKIKNRMIGVIYVDNRFEKNVFQQEHLRLLEYLASQAAVAIENARLFEENQRKQQDLEQKSEELDSANRRLVARFEQTSNELEEVREAVVARKERFRYDYSLIITRDPNMYEIFGVLDKVIETNVPVLVQGASGTGKELIARAIHFNSPRKEESFVSENCAAVPETLLESEFFGYMKGAFTGATADKKGLFEVAHKGTLFLDEIAEMPLAIQTKFLRVLQEGDIRRLGGKDTIRVDVRIISATNKDLFRLVQDKQFREDLFYRLNVITINLPPLCDRRDDIPLLVNHFLTEIARKMGSDKREIDPEAMDRLMGYDWPGNVRELENEIERAVALSRDRIAPEHLSRSISPTKRHRPIGVGVKTLKEIVNGAVEEVEREAIAEVLEKTGWHKTKTAGILGISRPTLDAKIEKYELRRNDS